MIIHCSFSKAIEIEEYSLSCECLERLDLVGLVLGPGLSKFFFFYFTGR